MWVWDGAERTGQILIAYLFAGKQRDVSGKDFQLARRDFKQLLEHIDDVEKSLTKISELKEACHKMEDNWVQLNNQRGTETVIHLMETSV